jgi:hypothetical protein
VIKITATKVWFILYYSLFLFTIIEISALAGSDLIKNSPTPPTIPPNPSGFDYLVFVLNNVGYFFTLMTISTEYAIFGVIVLTPFTIAMIWAILELIRGG